MINLFTDGKKNGTINQNNCFFRKEEAYMKKKGLREKKLAMYEAILQLKTLEECCDFFQDICAETELHSMEQRFEVASMLEQNMIYSDIIRKTNASTATISRVSRMLNNGTGMLSRSLERMEEEHRSREKKNTGSPDAERRTE